MNKNLIFLSVLFLLTVLPGVITKGYCEKIEIIEGMCYVDCKPTSIRQIHDESGCHIRTTFEDGVFVDFYFAKPVMKDGKLNLSVDNPPQKILVSSLGGSEISILSHKNIAFEEFSDGAKQYAAKYEGNCYVSQDKAIAVVVALIQETNDKIDSANYFVQRAN